MPQIVHHRLPWLRVERHHVYAIGGSMGGQEVLLLVARHPHLLAGAIAFDAVANLSRQYYDMRRLRCDLVCLHRWKAPVGIALQGLVREEVGGTPVTNPYGYARRSPLQYARQIAFSHVPLELWWSKSDLIVPHQQDGQSGALFTRILQLNPNAPVEGFFGDWRHSYEERASSRLPFALAQIGLLPARYGVLSLPNNLHGLNVLPVRELAHAGQ
jgi:pimeloyl-ACP methyl ester carboxylesterase